MRSSSAMASASTRQQPFCFWNIFTCSFQHLPRPHEDHQIQTRDATVALRKDCKGFCQIWIEHFKYYEPIVVCRNYFLLKLSWKSASLLWIAKSFEWGFWLLYSYRYIESVLFTLFSPYLRYYRPNLPTTQSSGWYYLSRRPRTFQARWVDRFFQARWVDRFFHFFRTTPPTASERVYTFSIGLCGTRISSDGSLVTLACESEGAKKARSV